MSTDTTEAPTAAAVEEYQPKAFDQMSFAEQTEFLAKFTVFKGQVLDAEKAYRAIYNAELYDRYQQDKTPSARAEFGPGKVATFSIKESQDVYAVTDREKFAAWVEENYPTEAEATMVVVVQPAFEKALLGRLTEVDGVVYDDQGNEVDGVTFKKGAGYHPSNGFGTSWKGGDDAKAAALEAMLEADSMAEVMPVLTAGGDQ